MERIYVSTVVIVTDSNIRVVLIVTSLYRIPVFVYQDCGDE
jgi:hypothetical protein